LKNKKLTPKFSIVIPTKLARNTIKETLRTVLEQNYADFEIVISDASNSKDLKEYIYSLNDSRVKYVSSGKVQTFSDDWNFALNASSGDLVTFLGDDDGLIPGALSYAAKLLSTHDVDAVTWKKINYNWPDHIVEIQKNILEGESEPTLSLISARKSLNLLAKFRLGYARLPCIYNSFIKKETINKIKSVSSSGKFFSGVIPDVYSAIAISSVIDNYIYADFPLSVNGASSSSSGVMQGKTDIDKEQKTMISDVLSSHKIYHKDIGPFNTSIAAIVMGEYHLAIDILQSVKLPKPNWKLYIKYLIHEAKYSKNPELIMQAAEFAKNSRNIKSRLPKIIKSVQGPTNSFSGRVLLSEDMVANVYQASILCEGFIPNSVELVDNGFIASINQFVRYSLRILIRVYQSYKIQF
jgi:glycosyltransferase involved in cell wall biosynthesis